MTPDEFWCLRPAELVPYIEARIEWIEQEERAANLRVGAICAVLANLQRTSKSAKVYKAADFISTGTDDKEIDRDETAQEIFDVMSGLAARGD